jgi:multiple sugar transport system substrate-binding protein
MRNSINKRGGVSLSKKLIILLLCLVVLISAFSVNFASAAGKKVTLVVGDWPRENEPARVATFKKYQKIMLDRYNVEVVPDYYQYAVSSFLPKAAAGTLPILYNSWFTEVQKIVENGYAADITAPMKKAGWHKALNPQILPLISDKGKIYAIPKYAYVQGLECNIELFKAAGLVDANGVPKAPKTYEELAQTAKIIKDKTGAAGFILETNNNCGGWHFMNIAWSYGVVFEKRVGGKWTAAFNSPEGVAALQYVKDLKWKYKVLPDTTLLDWASGQQVLATNQGSMLFFNATDHDGFNFQIDNYKISKDNIAMFSLPAGPKGRYAQIGGDIWMFAPNATKAQIEAGLKWLELLGKSPQFTDEIKENEIANYKTDVAGKHVVGGKELQIWTDKAAIKARDELRSKYINVNLAMFKDYNENKATLRSEEPIACQELYKELDKVIQAVLTDANADPKALLDKAAANFQKDVLDKQ